MGLHRTTAIPNRHSGKLVLVTAQKNGFTRKNCREQKLRYTNIYKACERGYIVLKTNSHGVFR